MANHVWPWVPRKNATKGTPQPKKGEELVFFPPQWEEEGDGAGTTWPVVAVKDSTSFSNPHAAQEALKERPAQKQEAVDEEGQKTMEDSSSYSLLEEKEVTPAPEAEAEKDSDNRVPVPTPPVIPEPKDTEKHIPVPARRTCQSQGRVKNRWSKRKRSSLLVQRCRSTRRVGRTRLQPRLVKRRLRRLVQRRRARKCLHVSRKITKRQPQRLVHQCLT